MQVPVDALLSADGDQAEVFVVRDGQVRQTPVRVFRLDGNRLLISSGLQAGDQVVISGVGYLENEDSVLIVQR